MSFGSVSAMISSLKANRNALKNGKKNPFDKGKSYSSKSEKLVDAVQISEEERKKLHESIQYQSRLERKKELRVLSVTLLVTAIIITTLIIILF